MPDRTGFDSIYLNGRMALNLLEQLDFDADRITIEMYTEPPLPRTRAIVGWSGEAPSTHDRRVLEELAEDLGVSIKRSGIDGTLDAPHCRIILRCYGLTNEEKQGLHPIFVDILKGWGMV